VHRFRPRRRKTAVLAAILLVALPLRATARTAVAESAPEPLEPIEPIDRIVAAVDGDPILESDIERLIGLQIVVRNEGESDAAFRRRTLDRLVDNRLRLHELDRFGYDQAPIEEIDRRYQRIRDRFASEADFRAELARLDLDDSRLRLLVARQISILAYVEERLGPRVFVSVEDIRRHYEEQLVPELRQRGETVPPIESVREAIRAVIRERRLNEEIDKWTEGLRAEADVEEFLETDRTTLPPVVRRIPASGAP
jgi:hypothetical protein